MSHHNAALRRPAAAVVQVTCPGGGGVALHAAPQGVAGQQRGIPGGGGAHGQQPAWTGVPGAAADGEYDALG
jgi:hypothetical protein